MGDYLKRVHAGDSIEISARTWNTFVDVARDHLRQSRDQYSSGKVLPLQSGIILVKNDSGQNQDRFAVLGLGDSVIDPQDNDESFKSRVALHADTPDRHTLEKFVILTEAISQDDFGRAMLSGVTPVKLDVLSENDTYASPTIDDASHLTTHSGAGPAEILWKEAGTGIVWGIIRFPSYVVREFIVKDVKDDYLECVSWDGIAEGAEIVCVAKPYWFRVTPWNQDNGGQCRDGYSYSTYESNGQRRVSTREEDNSTEDQVLTPQYCGPDDLCGYPGDRILARRASTGMTYVDVDGEHPIVWTDTDEYWSRAWAKDDA